MMRQCPPPFKLTPGLELRHDVAFKAGNGDGVEVGARRAQHAQRFEFEGFGEGLAVGRSRDKACKRGDVAAHVQDAAAAQVEVEEARVGVLLGLETEGRFDGFDFPQGARRNQFHDLGRLRVTAIHKCFQQGDAVSARRFDGAGGLGRIQGEGFLAQNMFARLGAFDDPLEVHRVRRRDIDGVHFGVAEQFIVGAVRSAGAQFGRKGGGGGGASRGNSL